MNKPPNVSEASWAIFLQVKANSALLQGCPRPHDFEPDPADTVHNVLKRQRCKKCGGTMDSLAAAHYNDGLKDGREERA